MANLFYRIGIETEQGLWYDKSGQFTGLIHNKYNWCNASKLQMPFDKEIVGYLSVADSLEHLYQWFSKEEILKFQKEGFFILEYLSNDFKFYEPYQHNVINQNSSIIHNHILLI